MVSNGKQRAHKIKDEENDSLFLCNLNDILNTTRYDWIHALIQSLCIPFMSTSKHALNYIFFQFQNKHCVEVIIVWEEKEEKIINIHYITLYNPCECVCVVCVCCCTYLLRAQDCVCIVCCCCLIFLFVYVRIKCLCVSIH